MICGVDISKDRLDCHLLATGEARSFDNDASGIAALAQWCRDAHVDLAAMEATGSYERLAFLVLSEAGIGCAMANAKAVRHFAQSMGLLEKNDRLDAAVIARFAQVKGLEPLPPPSLLQQQLTAFARRLSQLVGDLCVCKQRIATCHDPMARRSLVEQIAFLNVQIKTFQEEIIALIDDDPVWSHLDRTFRSVKGVADRTVARLLADLPEIGLLPNKAIAKIVGLAPIADDSGKRSGHRRIAGGRASVRSILFLVADVARRFDASLQAFAQRLQKAGKPKMVIRIALAHKLLVRLNAKARDARIQLANAT
jgi:transposase